MNAGGKGNTTPGREQNITPPGCSFKSSAVAFGERTVNQGPWLSKEEPCTFKNNLTYRPAFACAVAASGGRGEYVMHQWLWDLFPGGKESNFFIVGKNSRARFAFLYCRRTPGGK